MATSRSSWFVDPLYSRMAVDSSPPLAVASGPNGCPIARWHRRRTKRRSAKVRSRKRFSRVDRPGSSPGISNKGLELRLARSAKSEP